MKMALVPVGKFLIGSPKSEKNRQDDEAQHEVEIGQPFYLGIHEVTQKQFEDVMGYNPSFFSASAKGREGATYHDSSKPGGGAGKVRGLDTSSFPVENVSWEEAREFCEKLSALAKERASGRVYRLPTEAEWEYACREAGAKKGPFHFGDSLASDQANFIGEYPYGTVAKGPILSRTAKAGSYKPNALGLYDLHGNVYEWCADWYDKGYYPMSLPKDPTGPETETTRAVRGGTWAGLGSYCRAANRFPFAPDYRNYDLGFRVVCVPLRAP